jgi:hypothetical protein
MAREMSLGSTIQDAYRSAGQVFLLRLPILLVLGLAAAAVQLVSWRWAPGLGLAGFAFSVLLAIPLKWGFSYVCLRAVRDEVVEPRDVLRAFDHYVNAAAAAALVLAMVTLGLVLLIVPGVYLYCRTRFVPYLVTHEDMDALEAIRTSWHLTEDHLGAIFGISVVGLLLSGLGMLFAGIGALPALILWDLALASYYHRTEEVARDADLDAPGSVYAE